jgi:hypothetical protein
MRTKFTKLQKCLRNGHFFGAQIFVCRRVPSLLTAFAAAHASRKFDVGNTKFSPQKKLRKSRPEASPWRSRERESSESTPTDSQNRPSISLRKPLDKAPDMVIAASIHAPRGR